VFRVNTSSSTDPMTIARRWDFDGVNGRHSPLEHAGASSGERAPI